MAVTAFIFGVPIRNQWDGTSVTDFNTDTMKVALVTSAFTPNQDTNANFSDVTGEATGTGYTAGGVTLTTPTVTYDTASDQIRLSADSVSWASSTITAHYAIVYKSTGTPSTSQLLACVNFGADVSTTNGTFQITWDPTGIVVFDVT